MLVPVLWPAFGSLPAVASAVAIYALGDGLGMLVGDKLYSRINVKALLLIATAVGLFGAAMLVITGQMY